MKTLSKHTGLPPGLRGHCNLIDVFPHLKVHGCEGLLLGLEGPLDIVEQDEQHVVHLVSAQQSAPYIIPSYRAHHGIPVIGPI